MFSSWTGLQPDWHSCTKEASSKPVCTKPQCQTTTLQSVENLGWQVNEKHNILEPLPEHPYEAYKRILFVHKDPFFCTQRYLFIPTSSPPFSPSHLIIPLLHSSLPHSSNATYTYNGLGIISFHKDGVLTGSRLLWRNVRILQHASPILPWNFFVLLIMESVYSLCQCEVPLPTYPSS
jgi:hypothetical protein